VPSFALVSFFLSDIKITLLVVLNQAKKKEEEEKKVVIIFLSRLALGQLVVSRRRIKG